MKNNFVEEIKISWEDFKKAAEKNKNDIKNNPMVYRGHASSEWELKPALYRDKKEINEIPAKEKDFGIQKFLIEANQK